MPSLPQGPLPWGNNGEKLGVIWQRTTLTRDKTGTRWGHSKQLPPVQGFFPQLKKCSGTFWMLIKTELSGRGTKRPSMTLFGRLSFLTKSKAYYRKVSLLGSFWFVFVLNKGASCLCLIFLKQSLSYFWVIQRGKNLDGRRSVSGCTSPCESAGLFPPFDGLLLSGALKFV